MPRYFHQQVDYTAHQLSIESFLSKVCFDLLPGASSSPTYSGLNGTDREESASVSAGRYSSQVRDILERRKQTFAVWIDDVAKIESELLAKAMCENVHRFVALFSIVLDAIMSKMTATSTVQPDVLDMYLSHVEMSKSASRQLPTSTATIKLPPPPAELSRRFTVRFIGSEDASAKSVRDIKAPLIGQLVKIRALVTRVGEVRPWLFLATYCCEQCGGEVYQPINSETFTPSLICKGDACRLNRNSGYLTLQSRGSRFVAFQEGKIQELTDQVLSGSIPRALTLWCMADEVRQLQPGDCIQAWGVFMPIPKAPSVQYMQGLLTDSVFLVHNVTKTRKWIDRHVENSTDVSLRALHDKGNLYEKIARSIAPEIYGYEDVKKALTLLLVGGRSQKQKGLKIRGNINICLIGDPGIAKSQLLAFICRLAPVAQYATGRGSSGVGLTAAVLRDPMTKEAVLEGGALVLADGGICCIDEFDKMSEVDRVAIHEVMEQQSISVAKAGIQTTLNARVSVLAAANPVYGRYRPDKSIDQNVGLSAALLSRFDLLWLLRDVPNKTNDERLAHHVIGVHSSFGKKPVPVNTQPQSDKDFSDKYFTMVEIRGILKALEDISPKVSKESEVFLVSAYVQMRADNRDDIVARSNRPSISRNEQYTSARVLLSMIRLASAHACLRLSSTVETEDVEEAIRLMEASKQTLVDTDRGHPSTSASLNTLDKIFLIILDLFKTGHDADEELDNSLETVSYQSAMDYCNNLGYPNDQFLDAIEQYEQLNILKRIRNGTALMLL